MCYIGKIWKTLHMFCYRTWVVFIKCAKCSGEGRVHQLESSQLLRLTAHPNFTTATFVSTVIGKKCIVCIHATTIICDWAWENCPFRHNN